MHLGNISVYISVGQSPQSEQVAGLKGLCILKFDRN